MSNHPTTETRNPKRRRFLTFFAVVAISIVAAILLNNALGARNLEALEDTRAQLQIPDSWVLSDETVTPPGLFGGTTCNFGATQCPQIQLTFNTPEPIATPAELKTLLPEAEWKDGDASCAPRPNLSSLSATLCAADAHFNDTEVHVSAGGAVDDGEVTDPWVIVRIHNR